MPKLRFRYTDFFTPHPYSKKTHITAGGGGGGWVKNQKINSKTTVFFPPPPIPKKTQTPPGGGGVLAYKTKIGGDRERKRERENNGFALTQCNTYSNTTQNVADRPHNNKQKRKVTPVRDMKTLRRL